MDWLTKLMLGLGSALAMAAYSSLFYANLPFELPTSYALALELFILSLPFYFFLTYTEDGLVGFLGGVAYAFLKPFLSGVLSATVPTICIPDVLVFALAFGIYATAMGFQKENAMKEAKLSMIGSVAVILAYFIALFMLIVYDAYFAGAIACYELRWLT